MKNMRIAIVGVTCSALIVGAVLFMLHCARRTHPSIFHAVQRNNCDELQAAIGEGQHVEMRDELGMTPLHYAAYYGFMQCATILMDGGASPGVADHQGRTPLHQAAVARDDRDDMIELLVRRGAKVNVKDLAGRTPLYDVAGNLDQRTAKSLLENGADPNSPAVDGTTPLFRAVGITDRPMVSMLLDAGADVNIRDESGRTVLDVASGNRRMTDLLVRNSTHTSTVPSQ